MRLRQFAEAEPVQAPRLASVSFSVDRNTSYPPLHFTKRRSTETLSRQQNVPAIPGTSDECRAMDESLFPVTKNATSSLVVQRAGSDTRSHVNSPNEGVVSLELVKDKHNLYQINSTAFLFEVRRMEALMDFRGVDGSPGSLEMIPMDVTESISIKRGVRAVIGRARKIDILINNAGIGLCGGIAETNLDEIKSLFDTNVIGLINVTQEVVPFMVERKEGKIVNMGSMLSYVALPWFGPYCASKSAVKAITSSLRMELDPLGIQVLHVSAGSVKSNLNDNINKRAALQPTKKGDSIASSLGNTMPSQMLPATGTEVGK
ncbi:hypothetical protein HK100_005027 [Physocladia obscura]|uniref:Uncharacterized protein n=1 Tax=Physocladia obscura TaxID=109957 RepID=A0AAD5X9L3_9FUNG|nr:hypothetical protein HK100_005027 [Physocladia obscura]